MRLTKFAVLTGTALAVGLSAIAADVVQAQPDSNPLLLAQSSPSREPKIRGVVRSVVGTQVLVELERSEDPLMWVGVSQSDLGAMNLMGGTPVFVQGRRIVGLAPRGISISSPSDFSSRVESLWAEYDHNQEEPRSSVLPSSEPMMAPVPQTAPIPGLW
ncbi:hypothetical protein [Spirulina subsalsa]|uniref:hypothetical protein n=1 Tax=Spirulina subsalsa TaxID=54311 RepID=UPI0003601E5D|nr:hypothetical protein [Spirulina subsalsa]